MLNRVLTGRTLVVELIQYRETKNANERVGKQVRGQIKEV